MSELNAVGLSDVKVTSTFTGYILYAGNNKDPSLPFMETDQGTINSLFNKVSDAFPDQWVFSINIYPYFDPFASLDPGTTDQCNEALQSHTCYDGDGCSIIASLQQTRQKINQINPLHSNHELWLTETGWSCPVAATLHTSMELCNDWSSMSSFRAAYENFLSWDMSANDGDPDKKAPDKAFLFTMRDSTNFGIKEGFGLIEGCSAAQCKITTKGNSAASFLGTEIAVTPNVD
jgi:hypothetical protein